MIKFFRKIRQQLLKEGKLGKYLAYALGEILLVVIGILIALNINNWNTERLEKKEEHKLLMSLITEFESNQVKLLKVIERLVERRKSLHAFKQYIGPNKEAIDGDLLEEYVSDLLWSVWYTPQKGVVNSILTSGKLSLIKNDQLVFQLSSLSSIEKVYNNNAEYLEHVSKELLVPYMYDKFPFSNLTANKKEDRSLFEYKQKTFLRNVDFENSVYFKTFNFWKTQKSAEDLFKAQEEILNLINLELND